jgi:hypothetical protein
VFAVVPGHLGVLVAGSARRVAASGWSYAGTVVMRGGLEVTFGAGAGASAEPVVSLRMADGSEVRRALRDVRARQVVAAVPWRAARSARGQSHYRGFTGRAEDEVDVLALADAEANPHVHLRAQRTLAHRFLGGALGRGEQGDRHSPAAPNRAQVTQAPACTGRGYRAGDPVTDVAADAPPAPPSLTVPYLEFLQSTTKTRRWARL